MSIQISWPIHICIYIDIVLHAFYYILNIDYWIFGLLIFLQFHWFPFYFIDNFLFCAEAFQFKVVLLVFVAAFPLVLNAKKLLLRSISRSLSLMVSSMVSFRSFTVSGLHSSL